MRIFHDLTFLDFAILLKETSDLGFGEAGMDSSNEEVRSRVDRTILILAVIFFGSPIGEEYC